jgi:hypothetical protein
MKSQISALLEEAKIWLSSQGVAAPQSAAWYAFGNFQAFIEAIEREPTELSIEKAVHALRHHIVDQYDWSAEYCKSISNFCDRADQIRRGMKRKGCT